MKVKAIIEVAGFPKEHVDETIIKVIAKLKEDFKVEKHDVYETIPLKDKMEGFWSTFCDIEISFKDVDELVKFCFEFMPSSIEVLDPEELKFDNVKFANIFNDLLARLHYYDMMVKNLNASNQIMKKKMDKSNLS